MESQKTSKHQSNAEKREQSWRYKHLILQTILQSDSNQNSMTLTGTRTDTNPWNRTESPETNPHAYGQLIYEKGGNNMQWRKQSFQQVVLRKLHSQCKTMKLEHSLSPYTKL